jgi:hypothetical protein
MVITEPQLEKDATCDCQQHACRVGSVTSNGVSHQCTFSTLLENPLNFTEVAAAGDDVSGATFSFATTVCVVSAVFVATYLF